ncbi:MAG: sialidase family protein [Steroidobacteraceae bacterium]
MGLVLVVTGCVATGPTALTDCNRYGGVTFDPDQLLVTHDGALVAAGVSVHEPACILGVPRDGWRPTAFRSTDRGETWVESNLPAPSRFVPQSTVNSVAEAEDGRLYAAVGIPSANWASYLFDDKWDSALAVSNDGGAKWQSLPRPPMGGWIAAIAAGRDGRLFANVCNWNAGVMRSDDAGEHWSRTGLKYPPIQSCSAPLHRDDAGHLYAFAGGSDGPGVYRSSDNGEQWTRLPIAYSSYERDQPLVTIKSHGRFVIVVISVAAAFGPSTFYGSADGGETWVRFRPPLKTPAFGVAVGPKGQLFLLQQEELFSLKLRNTFFSPDFGASWEDRPPIATESPYGVQVVFDDAGTLYYGVTPDLVLHPPGTFGGRIYRSEDTGLTWKTLPVLPPVTQ